MQRAESIGHSAVIGSFSLFPFSPFALFPPLVLSPLRPRDLRLTVFILFPFLLRQHLLHVPLSHLPQGNQGGFLLSLGLKFPFSHESTAPLVAPTRIPSSLWDIPSLFLRPRILSGVNREAFTSSGEAANFGSLALLSVISFARRFIGANAFSRFESLSLIPQTSFRRGRKTVFTSCLASRSISDLMVDSIFPKMVSFESLMVLSYALNFNRNLHLPKKIINRQLCE